MSTSTARLLPPGAIPLSPAATEAYHALNGLMARAGRPYRHLNCEAPFATADDLVAHVAECEVTR